MQLSSIPATQVEPDRRPSTFSNAMLDSLEKLAKATGVVAVFGYLSVRCHLNFLGVPSQTTLGVDRYLMEAWQFFSALCYSPDLLLLVIAAGLCLFVVQARAEHPSTRFGLWRRIRSRLHLDGWIHGAMPPLLLIACACGLMLRELVLLSRAGTSVIVGTLAKDPHGTQLAAMRVRAAGEDHFLLVALFCTLGFSMFRLRPRELEALPTGAWKGCAFVLVLLTLQLPVIYGSFVRTAIYSKVEVRQKEQPDVCGALILDTGERFVLWRALNGRGWIEVVPAKEARMRALGDLDVLAEAGKSIGSSEETPSCKEKP